MLLSRVLKFALIGAAFALTSGCSPKIHVMESSQKASETFTKDFVAKGIDTLNVVEANGDIEVTLAPKDKDEIGVVAEKTLTGSDSEERLRSFLPRFHVTAVLEGKSLVVGSHWQGDPPHGASGNVHYKITVPARLKVNLSTRNGDIKAEGVEGGAKIATENGNVELKNTQGAHNLSTKSGGIRLTDVTSTSPLTASTENGDIHATNLIATAVTAKTENGSIDLDTNAPTLNLTSTNGSIGVTLAANAVISEAKAETTNGSIKFALPESSASNLKATSENGSVKVTRKGATQQADRVIDTSLSGKGGRVTLHTENGEAEATVR